MQAARVPKSVLLLLPLLLTAGLLAPAQAEGRERSWTLHSIDSFGSNPGNLELLEFVPKDLPKRAPLVVVAHGCFQTALEAAENSGWVELAMRYRFALLFPQTSKANEPAGGCFRTWQPEHQQRDAGEPLSIRQMVGWMLEEHGLDPERVFMTGMSSGGLVTNIMLATYPEVFAAGALQSSYPYNCASEFEDLKPCSAGETGTDGEALAETVREALPEYSGDRPRVSIWHGDSDPLLLPVNLELQMEQWTRVLGVDQEPDELEEIGGHSRNRYVDGTGNALVETWMIRGLEHAVAVDPDGTPRCGVAGPFFGDVDICAALWISRWFGIVR
jgi:poly(hydroxyalkanoate) depolymerase family esterase